MLLCHRHSNLCFLAQSCSSWPSLLHPAGHCRALWLSTCRHMMCAGASRARRGCVCAGLERDRWNLPNRLLLFLGVRETINQVFRLKTHFYSLGEQCGVLHMVTVFRRALSLYGKLGLFWELVGIHNLRQGVVCYSSPLCHGHGERAGPLLSCS